MNEKSISKISELSPELIKIVHKFIPEVDKYLKNTNNWKSCTTEITEGKRDIYYQAGLWSIGREFNAFKCQWKIVNESKVVTRTLNSKHLQGKAFDVALCNENHLYLWPDPKIPGNKQLWADIASIGTALGLICGANWKTPDVCHFEIL